MKPPTRITAHLDRKAAEQMAFLRKQTLLTVSEIIKRAIDVYACRVLEAQPDTLAVMERAGFVGCADGPKDLAETAKEEFARGMGRKSPHGPY